MTTIRTAHDARTARMAGKYNSPSKSEIAAGQDAILRGYATDHPQIGELIRKGRPVFYITAPDYRESADPRDLATA